MTNDAPPTARLLLVHGDDVTRTAWRDALATAGIACATASTVAEGQALGATLAPALLLAAAELPDGTGLALCPRTPDDPPLVLLAEQWDEAGVQRALAAGAWDCFALTEPLALLVHRVKRFLASAPAPAAEALFHRALAATESSIVITDATAPDMPILYVNPAFEQVTGYRLGEVQGRNCRFLQGPESDQGAVAFLRRAIAQGRACRVDILNYRKDGTPFWNRLSLSPIFDERQRLTHFIGVQLDITESRQVQAALSDARAEWDAAVDSLADLILLVDQEGQVARCNRPLVELLGGATARLLHRPLHLVRRDFPALDGWFATTLPPHFAIGDRYFRPFRYPITGRDGSLGMAYVAHDITEQRRAEQELREREASLRLLTDQLPAFVWMLDDRLMLRGVYGRNLEHYGWHNHTPLPTPLASTLDPTDRNYQQILETHQRALAGESIRYKYEGGGQYFEIILEPLWDERGQCPRGCIGLALDITAQHEAEAALRRSEAHYRALVQNGTDLVSICDEAGIVRYVSPSVSRLWGYASEELIGKSSFQFVHPEDQARIRASFTQKLAQDEGAPASTFRFRDRAGRWRHVEGIVTNLLDNPAVQGIVINARDVTERQTMLERLATREAQLTGIISSAMDAIISVDEQYHIVLYNQAAEAMFGYSRDAMLGQPLDRLLPTTSRRGHEQQIATFGRSAVTTRTMGRLGTLYGLRASGERFPIEASISQGRVGEHCYYTAILRDITERLRAEQQMVRAERLAALGRLAAILAHEINNPLQAIQNQLDLVLDYPLPPHEQRHYLERMRQEIERLSQLSRRVLNFARPAKVPRHPTALGELIEQVIPLVQKQMHLKGLTLHPLLQTVPPVYAAPDQLVQVILNLLLNAIDATPAGGQLHLALYAEGEQVIIALLNEGEPIDDEHLAHLFEPFFTTKEEGNGMGLSISHSIVRDHGGTVEVDNLPDGQGVCFRVILPAHQP